MAKFTVDTNLVSQLGTQLDHAWVTLSESPPSSMAPISDGETGWPALTDALHQYGGVAQKAHQDALDALGHATQIVTGARKAYDQTEQAVTNAGEETR
jgi:hypothetical protein